MSSAVLLDEDLFTQKGMVKLNVNRTFQMNITAAEARSCVHRWLVDEVSSNIGAEMPALLLAERPVWRVPAWLSFPSYGRIGEVGSVDVDVETGHMLNLAQSKVEIERCAQGLVQRLPAYQPRRRMSQVHRSATIPTAPKLFFQEDDFLTETEFVEN